MRNREISHPGTTDLNKAGSLGKRIFDVVGNPAYCDTLIEFTRLKWSQPFTFPQLVKLKAVLERYNEYVIDFESSFQQRGRATSCAPVLKLLVHPNIITNV